MASANPANNTTRLGRKGSTRVFHDLNLAGEEFEGARRPLAAVGLTWALGVLHGGDGEGRLSLTT